MSKTTATLFKIIRDDLINNGHNEFWNNGQITDNNDEFAITKKILRYDDDVKVSTDRIIFGGFTFEHEITDKLFKKMFLNKFIDCQIMKQTIDSFQHNLVYELISKEVAIDIYCRQMADYILGKEKTEGERDNDGDTNLRNVYADDPQDIINFDLNNPIFEYANNHSGAKSDNKDHSEYWETREKQDLEKVTRSIHALDEIFKILYKRLFLHIR